MIRQEPHSAFGAPDNLLKSGDKSPADCEVGIADVVNFACHSVPAIYKNAIACSGLDRLWVLDDSPWELWEALSGNELASFHLPKAILLTVAGIPNPIDEEVGYKKGR